MAGCGGGGVGLARKKECSCRITKYRLGHIKAVLLILRHLRVGPRNGETACKVRPFRVLSCPISAALSVDEIFIDQAQTPT